MNKHRPVGRPKKNGQKLSHTISVGMTESDIQDLEDYRNDQEIKPSQASVILTAFRQFIARKKEESIPEPQSA